MKGTGKALKVLGKLSSKSRAIVSPKFTRVKEGILKIPSGQKGKKFINLEIGGTVKKLAEPLSKQAKLAGKRVNAVSAQADRLVSLLRTKRIVRKPIPNEVKLSFKTKKLLKRFDEGRINKKQLIRLNNRITRETGQAGSLLERSFFADPRGRLRPSRLGGKQEDASLLDILSGDVTFKSPKPQVILFENVKVQKFPDTPIFKNIKAKLKKKNPQLTKGEAEALLKFQLKPSGKFKPIGALSKEPEITLAPGEIIKKEKTIAVTIINGQRVPIVRAKVIKASKSTQSLLKKAKKGQLKKGEIKKLEKKLERETGFKTSLSRKKVTRKRVRTRPIKRIKIKRRIVARRSKTKRPKRMTRRVTTRPRVGRPPIRVPSRRTRPIPRIPGRPRITPRPGPRPIPHKAVPGILKFKRKKRKLKKKKAKKQSFDVFAKPVKKLFGKRPRKLIKINKVPLTKTRAKDLRNFITDTSLARTSKIKPTRGKPKRPKLKIPRGFAKRTSKKFRRFRIIKGKRRLLPRGKVIEKRRNLLDTRQEKRKIGLRRRITQITKPKIKRRKKK